MYVQGVENVYELDWDGVETDQAVNVMAIFSCRLNKNTVPIILNMPIPMSASLKRLRPCASICWAGTPPALPAYDQTMKASHLFNLLDARGVISVTERQAYIGRVRDPAKGAEAGMPPRGAG